MTATPFATAQSADAASQTQDVFNDLVKLGHRLARVVVDQAEATTIPAIPASKAFNGVTLSIRRCAWLAHKLAQPVKTVDRVAARKRIIRKVEDAIQRHDEDGEDAETLNEELMDRLDTLDLEDEIDLRPVEDIITDILRDLGLASVPGNHPWKRRTPADLAELCARAARQAPAVAKATPAAPLHTRTQPSWPSQPHHQPVGCNSS